MKSIWVVAFVLVLMVGVVGVFAETSELVRDGRGTKVNIFAPDPSKEVVLTGNSQTVDMSDDIMWSLTPASDCAYRTHSTATVARNLKTIPADTERMRAVNSKGAFSTYSGAGCANEILERQ